MVGRWVVAGVMAAALVGCTDTGPAGTEEPTVAPTPERSIPESSTPTPSKPTGTKPTATKPTATKPTATKPTVGRTVGTMLAIPSIGVRALRVVAYTGTADDKAGTVIQDRGVFASPRGPAGGVGAGEIGNFIVTGHRTTHGRPLGRLPELANGDHVFVTANGRVYDYVVSQTMTISFRKPAEKAQQNAAVPGRPGVAPTRAMLTLSTCATPEDHAAGNYWKDALNNPEHRINKIATLVGTRPAG